MKTSPFVQVSANVSSIETIEPEPGRHEPIRVAVKSFFLRIQ